MKLNKLNTSELILNTIKPTKVTFKIIKSKIVELKKLKSVK